MTSLLLNIIALLSCIISAASFDSVICKLRTPRLPVLLVYTVAPVLAGLMVWCCSFLENEILAYLIILTIESIVLKLFFHLTWQQAIFAGVFATFLLVCIKGITVGLFAIALRKNLYQVITVPQYFFLVLIITMVAKSVLVPLCYKAIDSKKVQSLFLSEKELGSVLIQHSALFIFMLFYCYNYYYNLDLVWFSFAQILLSALMLVLYFLIINYGIRVSNLLENDVYNELLTQQLKAQLAQHSSYKNTFSEIEMFKHQFEEKILSLNQLIKEGNTAKLQIFASDHMSRLLELLPCEKEYSNNEIINAMLLDWDQQCIAQNLSFVAMIYVPNEMAGMQKDIASLLWEAKNMYLHLAAMTNKGKIQIEGKKAKNRFVVQMVGPYHGIISAKYDMPYFETANGLQVKTAYHRVSTFVDALEGTIFWDTDESNSLFKLTISIRL